MHACSLLEQGLLLRLLQEGGASQNSGKMQPSLSESLKEICASGKWCYAVFWAVGRRNPRLLIWEHYHNASAGCSPVPQNLAAMMLTPPSEEWKHHWLSSERHLRSSHCEEDVQIMNKMMNNDHVVVVGAGLVGRAASIGYHHWFLSENFVVGAHHPEVSVDLDYQFSKGIKTVVVIPVLPHGVIRLGSTSTITEDMETVKNVKALIHKLHLPNRPTASLPRSAESTVESSNQLFPLKLKWEVPKSPEVLMKPDELLEEQASNFLQIGAPEKMMAITNRLYGNPFSSNSDPALSSQTANDLHAIFNGCKKRKHPMDENDTTCTVNGEDDHHVRGSVHDGDTGGRLFSSTFTTDNLLDSVVSSAIVIKKGSSLVTSQACDSSSHNTSSVTMINSTHGGPFLLEKSPDNFGSMASGFGEDGVNSEITSWIRQSKSSTSERCSSAVCHKKADSGNPASRKRPKTGGSFKPRPKDRQLIQDRIKELRAIVPGGEKCSIDALLERTIMHILFFQSLVIYGDTLRKFHHFKVCRKDGEEYAGISFNIEARMLSEYGAVVGLIVVEHLSAPHLLLVEMVCEDNCFLWGISGIIKGLGLTTVRGLVEVRAEKICARLMVKGEREGERAKVFESLVRILLSTVKATEWSEKHGEFISVMLMR